MKNDFLSGSVYVHQKRKTQIHVHVLVEMPEWQQVWNLSFFKEHIRHLDNFEPFFEVVVIFRPKLTKMIMIIIIIIEISIWSYLLLQILPLSILHSGNITMSMHKSDLFQHIFS